jgi:WXG100 family type VII secretion target
MATDGGSGNSYQTRTTKMESVATEFETVNKALKGKYDELASNMNATSSKWQGESGVAFRKLMVAYNTDAEKLNTALMKIAQLIRGQKVAYTKIHHDSGQQISDIATKLAG